MPKKRRLTPEQAELLKRQAGAIRCSAWDLCKELKLYYNEGTDFRNKAAAMAILITEYEDQISRELDELMKYQDDD